MCPGCMDRCQFKTIKCGIGIAITLVPSLSLWKFILVLLQHYLHFPSIAAPLAECFRYPPQQ